MRDFVQKQVSSRCERIVQPTDLSLREAADHERHKCAAMQVGRHVIADDKQLLTIREALANRDSRVALLEFWLAQASAILSNRRNNADSLGVQAEALCLCLEHRLELRCAKLRHNPNENKMSYGY